ncbi:hypothetical protein [Dyadobacter psychrotolerans]|uniref:Head-tail adaptor protein n=1 Tax=Dyadobacter psychrotolerans TaxID=2541721 RepID=A0A4R5DTC4_9BACT|nr:hypothetical protein [Dyadobacter psychrotolerans]TDE17712.1 hypothetical protein E0F88_07425 [Dyadobacter psychrotolerans]
MKKLSQLSGMPQMKAAFTGWTQKITFKLITQTVVDGFVVDSEKTVVFNGTIQPLSAEEVILKPEGQRFWEWLDVHVMGTTVPLRNNDRVSYNGTLYKVMASKDYSLNNYMEFHIVRDYEAGNE